MEVGTLSTMQKTIAFGARLSTFQFIGLFVFTFLTSRNDFFAHIVGGFPLGTPQGILRTT